MSDRDLRKLQQELASLKSALLARMSIGREGVSGLRDGDIADRALGSYLEEMQGCRDDWNAQRLSLVEEALKRIRSQTYGRCEECGKMISKKRLAALPWARLCLKCKLAEEER